MKPGIWEAPRGSSLGLQGPMGICATPCQPGPRLPIQGGPGGPSASQFWGVAPRGPATLTQWGRHWLRLLSFIVRMGGSRLLPCQPWAEGISFAQREAGGTAHRSEVSTRGQGVPRVPR